MINLTGATGSTGRKFDVRQWVFVKSWQPLEVHSSVIIFSIFSVHLVSQRRRKRPARCSKNAHGVCSTFGSVWHQKIGRGDFQLAMQAFIWDEPYIRFAAEDYDPDRIVTVLRADALQLAARTHARNGVKGKWKITATDQSAEKQEKKLGSRARRWRPVRLGVLQRRDLRSRCSHDSAR